MREPQAASTLDALRQFLTPPRRRRVASAVATMLAMSAIHPAIVQAQIRRPADVRPDHGWWFSGGASAVTLTDITDGASNSTWRFGSDPLWQFRATIEKALDEFTTLGVAVGYGPVDVMLSSITTGANPNLPDACQAGCSASTELWTGMAQFRSGGGPRFHTLFEASGGGTAFRSFKTRAEAIPIPGIKSGLDVSGTLGAGFGFPLSRDMVISVVQDFGIGFHATTGLPEGTSRTWRVRNTRAALRFKFGGR